MKNSFYGYYSPSSDEYKHLWEEALIVLDTNVLLNLYRLPSTARDELLSVLELLKDRLWIPHQVALEFQRLRLTVISTERKSTEDALNAANELVSQIKKKVDALQLDKRGLNIDSQPLISELDKANSQVIAAIESAHSSQLDISSSDPIRERLDNLFKSKVGSAPTSQADVDALVSGGEERFSEKMPPGFMDANKEKNPNEANFIFDKIKYSKKFGDLILWRQLMAHAKKEKIESILLVTADRKEDWWWREEGKTIGPHPELIREMRSEGEVELFWMYSSSQFVEHANQYLNAKVSTESVAEIEQVALSSPTRKTSALNLGFGPNQNFGTGLITKSSDYYSSTSLQYMEYCVKAWLSSFNEKVEYNPIGFPDFLAYADDGLHGFELVHLTKISNSFFSPAILNKMRKGYLETIEGNLVAFTLIILVPEDYYFEIHDSETISMVNRKLTSLLEKTPIHSIVVGSIIGEGFSTIIWVDGKR